MHLAFGQGMIESFLCGDRLALPVVELSILSGDVDVLAGLDMLIALDCSVRNCLA